MIAIKEKKAPQVIQNWIKSREALAIFELVIHNLSKRQQEIEELTASGENQEVAVLGSLKDPRRRKYCSLYLYNLGKWYASISESSSKKISKNCIKRPATT